VTDDLGDVWCGEVFAKGLRKSLVEVFEKYEHESDDYFFDVTCTHQQQEELLAQRQRLLLLATSLVEATEEFGSDESQRIARSFLQMLFRQEDQKQKLGLLGFVYDVAYLTIARAAIKVADNAVDRFWDLLGLMSDVSMSGRTLEFLRRVSRCYLFGFDAECAIMCRGVLDAELESHVAREDVLDTADTSEYSLDNRIVTALRRKIISFEAAEKAHRVRQIGNHRVHRSPEQPKDVLKVIKDTLWVISELAKNER
jgi:hypothetical protein